MTRNYRYDPIRRTSRDRALRAANRRPHSRRDTIISVLCLLAGLVVGLASWLVREWVVRHW